ncbi:hypothetical protein EYF80_004262 [Liparis tanakae]|uniref:Uncharacterized protein n=1 Tax=Liparis tanakae TaxID=230148 RepID=A0A4Z2J601_9TELE|nr:hypothetical protein EYF80_004262 [Liparis tanakae]
MANKSIMFSGPLKNFHLLGEERKRSRYSMDITLAANDELGFSKRSQSFFLFSEQHVVVNSSPTLSLIFSASLFISSFICSFFWWYLAWQQDSSLPSRVRGSLSSVLHRTSWRRPPTLSLTRQVCVLLLVLSMVSVGSEVADRDSVLIIFTQVSGAQLGAGGGIMSYVATCWKRSHRVQSALTSRLGAIQQVLLAISHVKGLFLHDFSGAACSLEAKCWTPSPQPDLLGPEAPTASGERSGPSSSPLSQTSITKKGIDSVLKSRRHGCSNGDGEDVPSDSIIHNGGTGRWSH